MPRAEAVAIAGNTFVAVGARAEVAALAGPKTRRIDAGGASVVPGFIEGHMHLFAGASELNHLQLFGVHGFDNLARAVTDYLRANPGDGLVIAEQADYTILSRDEPVTRHHLDRITGDRPFLMFAPDHHTAWANTKALTLAGILKGRKLGPGNEIVMGPDGLAAGELREGEAIEPVQALSKEAQRAKLGLRTGGEPDPRPTPSEIESDLVMLK
ncbi:MAG: amidohydrolase family protein, partial [Alphaproteobacteria bacterium]|nr:amidohydrolase family protein [Alphaproteobacteria bacterium]